MSIQKKKGNTMIYLINDKQGMVVKQSISDFRIKEDYIYRKSIEKYNNIEPCIIIRTKIINSVLSELNQFIKKCLAEHKKDISIDEIPAKFIESIDFDEDVVRILIKKS